MQRPVVSSVQPLPAASHTCLCAGACALERILDIASLGLRSILVDSERMKPMNAICVGPRLSVAHEVRDLKKGQALLERFAQAGRQHCWTRNSSSWRDFRFRQLPERNFRHRLRQPQT